jgi:hypothetical protein
MGIRNRFDSLPSLLGDARFLGKLFPGGSVRKHEGWHVTEITADELVHFTGYDDTTFVNDDGSGAQTWEIEGRLITVRKDPDVEYRAYLHPKSEGSE